jgi:hypothetical protein
MATVSITIDATQLNPCHKFLLLYSREVIQDDWFDIAVPKTFQLEPDSSCRLQIGSGSFAGFNFTITSEGVVAYDTSCDAFIAGRGTSTLALKGLTVTLDARYISSTVLYPIELYFASNHITNTTWNMLPGEYGLIVGSGQRADFGFSLNPDGTFAYDGSYECTPEGNGGFLRGAGTSRIEFLGYPVLVDARAAGGNGVGFEDLGLGFSPTAVQFANLLPASNYTVAYKSSGELATFHLGLDGHISLPEGVQPPIIQVKKFHDLTLLVIAPTKA